MAKFLNKKEQVFHIELTTYGRYLMSIGKFEPESYAFFDDNILYDAQYAYPSSSATWSGQYEAQNDIHNRIKNDTQYFESLALFVDIEDTKNVVNSLEELKYFVDATPTQQRPRESFFRYSEPIGDAYMDNNRNDYVPAWKVVTLQNNISSSQVRDDSTKSNVPQINMDLQYTKKVNFLKDNIRPANGLNPQDIREITNQTSIFQDGAYINIETDDLLMYAEELNTILLNENFDLEIYKLTDEIAESSATAKIGFSTDNSFEDLSDGDTITIEHEGNPKTIRFKTSPSAGSDVKLVAIPFGESAFDYSVQTLQNLKDKIDDLYATTLSLTTTAGNFYDSTTAASDPPSITLTSTTPGTPGNEGSISTSTSDVFSITQWAGGVDRHESYKRKFFKNEIDNVQDGFMVANRTEQVSSAKLTTASVEYYFDIRFDHHIDQESACKGAEIFNKESYYIDLDFDCDFKPDEAIYYDIYGAATEPDICQ